MPDMRDPYNIVIAICGALSAAIFLAGGLGYL